MINISRFTRTIIISRVALALAGTGMVCHAGSSAAVLASLKTLPVPLTLDLGNYIDNQFAAAQQGKDPISDIPIPLNQNPIDANEFMLIATDLGIYDNGFHNTGVRSGGNTDPPAIDFLSINEDIGRGGITSLDPLPVHMAGWVPPLPLSFLPDSTSPFSGRATNFGAFKTPGLRNIALTRPYMHIVDSVSAEVHADFSNVAGGTSGGGFRATWDTSIVTLNQDNSGVSDEIFSVISNQFFNNFRDEGFTQTTVNPVSESGIRSLDFSFTLCPLTSSCDALSVFDVFYLTFDVMNPAVTSIGLGINGILDPWFESDGITTGSNVANTGGTIYLHSVPVPPAVWLFGSGLLGMVGVARRRRTNVQS